VVDEAPKPTPEPRERGDAKARLSRDDELGMDAVIVGRFFRPYGKQARWIDPRPLGDVRDAAADSTAESDDAWADAVRAAVGHPRVCVFDPDAADACHGRDGGVLRLSHAYADGAGAARVYVRWTPARDQGGDLPALGGPVFEMVFRMERTSAGGWHIASQHALGS
jgi:hypothetical protein